MLVGLGPAEGAVQRYQMETINSDGDFPSTADRVQWTQLHIAARAGRRSWRLSLTCFNAANQVHYPPPPPCTLHRWLRGPTVVDHTGLPRPQRDARPHPDFSGGRSGRAAGRLRTSRSSTSPSAS
eukprot:1647322-Prymnesium_polylepis.2